MIILDLKSETLKLSRYVKDDFEKANQKYTELEEEYIDNVNVEVVLVAVDDIDKLRKLYPNYFLDTEEFLKYLSKII